MDDSTRREFGAGLLALPLSHCAPPKAALRKREGWEPAYLRLEREGELARRVDAFREIYSSCRLCPRQCGVNRRRGEKGVCGGTARAKVYSAHPHFGEEPPLVGRGGSGTIFFSNCNLLCSFCQNWEINHRGDGSFISDESLGRMMVSLQNQGCHNINVVTPTHIAPNIVSALRTAIRLGLRVPIVYNCGGYESLEAVKLLDGIVDIYLPDFKYTDGAMAKKYSSGASDYPEAAESAHIEMKRQVGDLVVDENGVALRGLLIRHLVLPHNIAGTDRFVKFVAEKLGKTTWVNMMAQYRPEHRAREFPELSRRITRDEYRQALAWASEAGLTNVLTQ
jgi:putative pyruvate formate lyase activating enzyme